LYERRAYDVGLFCWHGFTLRVLSKVLDGIR
jgi:hypothetical protein